MPSVLYWYECPLAVLACNSLHVRAVCIWCFKHTSFCVDVFYAIFVNFHSFNHTHAHTEGVVVKSNYYL